MIYIYKATSPSGKVYIGLTNNFKKRKTDHLADAFNKSIINYNSAFKSAIRKYGKHNIQWQVIDSAKDYSTAAELEKRYILHFDSYCNGYNMTIGGEGASKYKKSDLIKIAQKYKTRLEWHKNSGSTYISAKNYGNVFFEKCCKHMPKPHYWTEQSILKLLKEKKYKNVEAWKIDNNGSRKAAEAIGKEFYNKCKNICNARKIWTKEEIFKIAQKYDSKYKWFKESNSSYQAAKRFVKRGCKHFFKECTEHMKKK